MEFIDFETGAAVKPLLQSLTRPLARGMQFT
jgi:hypothetical protein